MQLDTWLETALGTPTRVRVLRHLVMQEGRERTLREVARALHVNPSTARVALFALLDVGAVEVRRLGRTDGYRLVSGKVANLIRRVFSTEAALKTQVLKAIRECSPPGTSVVIFGSAARGEQGPHSDLDLLVVARTKDEALDASLEVGRVLGQIAPLGTSFISLGAADLRAKWRLPWIENVRREGVLVAGAPLDEWT